MATRLVLVALAVVFTAGLGLPQEKPAQGEQAFTGCLNAADQQGQFVLTVDDGPKKGQKIAVTGAADLEKHAKNHKVKLTGAMAKESGKDVFKVTKIEHIAATCEAPTE